MAKSAVAGQALAASALQAALAEYPTAATVGAWRIHGLIFIRAGDADFLAKLDLDTQGAIHKASNEGGDGLTGRRFERRVSET